MTTTAITPLRQSMIEDMNARKLCGHAARPHPRLQAVRGISEAISRDGHVRGHPPVPAALGRDRREHLHNPSVYLLSSINLQRIFAAMLEVRPLMIGEELHDARPQPRRRV
jgi:hypothetical protein